MLGTDADLLNLPSMPTPDYITLPVPRTASTSTSTSEIPPPLPPMPEDEPAPTGEKRKTKGKNLPASKAAKTESAPATATASNVNRIFTVLKEEDLKQTQLPSLQELERVLVERQKQELLKEFA